MKRLLSIFVLFLVVGCSNYPKGEMGLYVFDMRNDADFRYRVLQVIDLKEEQTQLITEEYFLDSPKYADFERNMGNITAVDESNDNEIIGRDLALVFASPEKELKMNASVGFAAHCYLYYLQGHFVGKEKFYVDSYQLTPMWRGCFEQHPPPLPPLDIL